MNYNLRPDPPCSGNLGTYFLNAGSLNGVWRGGSLKASNLEHGDSMYSQISFLQMSLGDERNILKIFVAGREITLPDLTPPTPPTRPPRPGAVEHQLVV